MKHSNNDYIPEASASKNESSSIQQSQESQKQVIQENRHQSISSLKEIQKYKKRVDKMLGDLTKLSLENKFDSEQPFELLFALEAAIESQEAKHLDLEDITYNIEAFRNITEVKFDELKMAHFQLLTFHADVMLIKLKGHHVPKFSADQVITTLTNQVEKRSLTFLLKYFGNTQQWCQIIIKQNFNLEGEFLERVIGLLKNPTQVHAWNIILAKPMEQVPFNKEISDIAWSRQTVPEVSDFIFQKIMYGDEYTDEFLKRGIYGFYKALILNLIDEEDFDVKIAKTETIMQSLQFLWLDDNLFANEDVLNSRILETISYMPLGLFNINSLEVIYHILKRICSNDFYNVNVLCENEWFRKLFKMLLFQQESNLFNKVALELMNNLIEDRLEPSCGQLIQDLISNYENAYKNFQNMGLYY